MTQSIRIESLVSQYEKLVYTICYQYTRNHHTAQDLVQETFLSAYTHLDSCPAENPKAWVARIATNKAKDFLKSAYHRRVYSAADDSLPEDKGALFIKEENPEAEIIGKDTCRAITSEIATLREPYTRVAMLYFVQQASVNEIAARLGRPPKTVQTQVSRARRQLQQRLVSPSLSA